MNLIRCLVVDDEPLARRVLLDYIETSPILELCGECSNALDAYSKLCNQKIDLLFLDIKMPVLSGIDLIKSLKDRPEFVITSAYSQYAVESYEINALDYLLKPITEERFNKSIDRYLRTKHHAPHKESRSIFIQTVNGKVQIQLGQIRWAKAMQNYIRVVTETEVYVMHRTMKSLESILPKDSFIRVHRSFIVNSRYVERITSSELHLKERIVPIGVSYKKRVQMFFGQRRFIDGV